MTLTFEDFPPGRLGTFGPRHVTRDEIVAFAAEFDPQPMHLDEEAASKSMLRGLSGSGWHLCSLMMRMMADGFITRAASLGSPGGDVFVDRPNISSAGQRFCLPSSQAPAQYSEH